MEVYAKASATSNSSGLATLIQQIPGTFSGLTPNTPGFQGRIVVSWTIWCATPLPGDAVTSISIQDIDGVIPSYLQPLFPLYPVIAYREDTALPSANQGIYLHSLPQPITPPPGYGTLPSGLYIVVVVQKASAVVDTIYATMTWDNLLSI